MTLRRRDFITVLGSAAAWPLAARAQQGAMPVIGYLSSLGQNGEPNLRDAFRRGLGEAGYVEGRNVAIEYRFAEDQPDRLPALAADLVTRKVAVIAATGGTSPILAAKAATATIPVVFTYGADPVQAGFVTSFNRPGANITGVTYYSSLLIGKVLGFLRDMVPDATVIALLVNPGEPLHGVMQSEAQDGAHKLGRQLLVLNASTPSEINTALASLRGRAGALAVPVDSYFSSRRQQIVALATRDAIPVIATSREFVAEGALMSYGGDVLDLYRRAGIYAGRVLKGEKPADLPVDQATKFELLINLKTAKALRITVPPTLVAIADEVIE
jgi:putative ABC transport system substrate-binding protein